MSNVVHLMDNMAGMARTPDKYFDLAVVDPPYGIADKMVTGGNNIDCTNKKKPIRRGQKGKLNSVNEMRKWDIRPKSEYYQELKRVSKHQIIWGANYLPEVMQVIGVARCGLIWDKQVSDDFTLSQFEYAYTSFNKLSRIFRYAHSNSVGFAPGLKGAARIGLGIHPTQKPIALYDWIFANYLPNGGKVLDTHVGSGSSRISAYKRGNIDFTGYEIDPDYWQAQEARYMAFVMQVAPAELEPVTKDGQIKLF